LLDGTITRSLQLRRRSSAQILSVDGVVMNVATRVDQALVRSVVLARKWARMLESGEASSIETLAKQQQLCVRNTGRMLPLAYLAPDLVEMILAGRQPASMNLSKLLEEGLPLAWPEQRVLFAQFA
jgi:site-specific DNA recombinase